MKKVLLIGPNNNKKKVLKKLQEIGVLEIEKYSGSLFEPSQELIDSSEADRILNTYKFLLKYEDDDLEDINSSVNSKKEISEVYSDLIDYQNQLSTLHEEFQVLKTKYRTLLPWQGINNEDFREIEERTSKSIQFWEVSDKVYPDIDLESVDFYLIVREQNQRKYFITFNNTELDLDGCIEYKLEDDLMDLADKMKDNENKQNEIENKIAAYLSRKEDLFKLYLSELNNLNFEEASNSAVDTLNGQVFAMQGWTPIENYSKVESACEEFKVHVFEVEPEKNEKIPTALENKGAAALGEGLVEFYDTPSYKDWDPSAWVFLSFTVFFAMIMGDGGYGLTLFLLLLFLRLRMKNLKKSAKRFFGMAMALTFATFVYGSLFSGFYGFTLPIPGIENIQQSLNLSFFDKFVIFRTLKEGGPEKNGILMKISVIIGLVHISLSLVLKALRDFSKKQFITPISNIAWIAIMWSFFVVYPMAEGSTDKLVELMFKTSPWNYIFITSLVAVFLTSAGTFRPGKLIGGGLGGLYNGVQFFSDVLSYIRIFALGLSGSLIAITFNNMAGNIFEAIPYAGPVLALLIFVFGHLLNIGLCLMGAVIHGLRLNFLEFYRWSFDGDGRAFKPLKDMLSE